MSWMGRTPGAAARTWAAAVLIALTCVACSKAEATGTRTYGVWVQQFRFNGLPATVRPGIFQISYSNREAFPFTHEMVLVSLQAGQTAQDVINDAKRKGESSEDDWLHFGEIPDVGTGATKVGIFDLPPGTYALACWEQGTPGGGTGEVHAARGMVYRFAVTP
jgi:hypothetical protein